jgi:hypothetical protein
MIVDDEYKRGQKLKVEVFKVTDLGLKVEFENGDEGLIYHSETDKEYAEGDELVAYVQKIREDEKIDLTAKKIGYRNFINSATDKVMSKLREFDGELTFHDKSDPDEIKSFFGLSKTQFKQAIGKLYKERRIDIHSDKIVLV